ncbi:alanine racemase [Spirochaetia bacterium]|nr:alanine racemase [Spirochaetia bacterium]
MNSVIYPALNIDMKKLKTNLQIVSGAVRNAGCSVMIVTKSFCADPEIVKMLVESPAVDYLADSRIANIKSYAGRGKETVLLRLPQFCEIEDTVRYADISFNSEIETLRLLDGEAKKQNKIHKAVLMIDLGDLREGLYCSGGAGILSTIKETLTMKNICLYGIGANLTCYGAIIPKNENLSILSGWARRIENTFGVKLAMVSGGNSSSYYLAEKGGLPAGINNLRLGEVFILGNDTAYGNHIEGTYADAITLDAQIIELQTKRSLPEGEVGMDAFGEKPVYVDRGMMSRAILAAGRQDIDASGMTPIEPAINVLGASSDHLILDVSGSKKDYHIGDIIRFKLNYGSVLHAFTSSYVSRRYV